MSIYSGEAEGIVDNQESLMIYGQLIIMKKLSKKIERLNQYQDHFGVDNTSKINKARNALNAMIDEINKDVNKSIF